MKPHYTILLVEDDPGYFFLAKEFLTACHDAIFQLSHIKQSNAAINHLQKSNAHLILLGLSSLDGNGLGVVRRVRDALPTTPVVVLADQMNDVSGRAVIDSGVEDYLIKGKFSQDLFERVVLCALEKSKAREFEKEYETFLGTAFDCLSAGIALLDDSGKILVANRSWQQLARESGTDSFVGGNYLDVCDRAAANGETDAGKFATGIRSVISGTSDSFGMEYLRHTAYQKRWYYGRVARFSASGHSGVVVAHENITEQKKAKEAVEISNSQLLLIIDTSPNCVYITDSQDRYVLVNRALANLFGTTPGQMIGKREREVHDQGFDYKTPFPDTFSGPFVGSGKRTGSHCYDASFTCSDGTRERFNIIKRPIFYLGSENNTLNIAVNVTAHWQVQDELRNSELRLKTILDAQMSRVILLNKQMQVLWPNKKACEEAGLSRSDIINKPCHQLWGRSSSPCKICSVALALDDGQPHSHQQKTSDGRTLRIHGFPVRDKAGKIVSAVEVVEDITGLTRLEGQLRQAQKMESLGTLAGGIAHDFNNILSGILGYTELALEKAKDLPALQGYLSEVYRAGMRATDLTKQILTFSRRTDTELSPLMITPTTREALKLLRSTLPTTIEIRERIDKNLGEILADPTQIHQIIMNLCTNASHAMEPFGGILEVGLSEVQLDEPLTLSVDKLQPGRYIRLTISDTGCGMSPEIITSIFDPYFTTKDLGEGTGLGLSVVHGIVNECGGGVSVVSVQGKGSTFSLYFPITKKNAIRSIEARREPLPTGTEHILVVDDEPAILKVLTVVLQKQGYQVTTDNDSTRALERFKEDSSLFDLVISDVTMPKLKGDSLMAEIKAIKPDIPVILCTGYSNSLSEQKALQVGAAALMIKPIAKKHLLTGIREVLDGVK